ncbi:MAG: hypothetical protein K6F99_09990 [Lachnospiraceae bacterium]|nr:hypothetical protein [Lachnospiraceae bacterium]
MNYEFGEVILHNKNHTKTKKRITLKVDEVGYELLSVFVSSELKNFYELVVRELTQVINGEEESSELALNRCELIINKEKCIIKDLLGEEPEDDVEIETELLMKIIDEWHIKINT